MSTAAEADAQHAELRPQRLHVADGLELLGHPGAAVAVLQVDQVVAPAPACSASKADSAASMPVFSALWLPLMRGTFTKPALSPTSTPPGKLSLGTDW
jgi:hypothetical protein